MLLKVTGPVRLISDPELKFAQSGTPVASFRGVTDQKRKNQATGEWEDDKVMFVRVTAFKSLAEHLAGSLKKGDTVVLTGSIHASEWETNEGEKRTTIEILADEIGTSMRWGPAPSLAEKKGGSGQAAPQQAANPWGSPSNQDDAPPF